MSTLIFSAQAFDLNKFEAVAKPICEEYQSGLTDLAFSKMLDYGISQSFVDQTLEKLSSISKKARAERKAKKEKLKEYYSEKDEVLDILSENPDNNILKARLAILEEQKEKEILSEPDIRDRVLVMANDIFSKNRDEYEDVKSETCKKNSNGFFTDCDEIMDTML